MKFIMLSVRVKVWVDKKGGERGIADGGRGSRSTIADKRNSLTSFMMHNNQTSSRVELAAKTAVSNMGSNRGINPGHPPKKVGLAKSRLLGILAGREAADEDNDIMGYLKYRESKGGPPRRGRGSPLH